MSKIIRQKVTTYKNDNREFNALSAELVADMMQNDGIGPEGYVPTSESEIEARNDLPLHLAEEIKDRLVDISEELNLNRQSGKQSLKSLPPYERKLIANIGWGQFTTYVLIGDMGSGKTTSANYALDWLSKPRSSLCSSCAGSRSSCKPVIIRIDFNNGFRGRETDRLVKQFHKLYYTRLRAHLRRQLSDLDVVIDFARWVAEDENRDLFSEFDRLAQEYEEKESEWEDLTSRQRSNRLFSYIDESGENWEGRLNLALLVARFLGTALRRDQSCFAVLLDNLDSVWAPAQHRLLLEILAHQRFAGATTIVPLRYSTFDGFKNNAAYAFGIIVHAGANPSEVLRRRLEKYLGKVQEEPLASGLRSDQIFAVENRLRYASRLIKSDNRFARRFRAFSGASIRHALYCAERVFLNNAVPWDRDPSNENELTRAVMLGASKEMELSPTDPCVANLFGYPGKDVFSLLCFRIVQLLFTFRHQHLMRGTHSLVPMVRTVGRWSEKDVLSAVNYLLFEKRPIIWVDGREKFESVDQLLERNEILNLTYSGYLYWTVLVRDLEYLQESVIALDWPERSDLVGDLPTEVDYGSSYSRFRTLLLLLDYIVEVDLLQTRRFVNWKAKAGREFALTVQLGTSIMVYHVAAAIRAIIRSSRGPLKKDSELVAMLIELVVKSYNGDSELGFENQKLKNIERRLRKDLVSLP